MNGMWEFNLEKQQMSNYMANTGIDVKTKKDLASYLHKSCLRPKMSTWIKAIENNNFLTWPGLSKHLINKHLEKSEATMKGHMKQ